MSKRIFVLLLAALLLLGLVGCGDKSAPVDGQALYEQMAALNQFPDMARRNGEAVFEYYGIDPEQCVQLVNYASADGLLAEEFLFVEAKQEAYAQEVEAMLQEQVEHLSEAYRDYMPEEYEKLKNARLERQGTVVLLLVAEDVAPLYKLFTDATK